MDLAYIKEMPKVLLHEHLDGCVRPKTIIDLASQYGIQLPATDEQLLAKWFIEQSQQKDLQKCLATFQVSCSVMQWETSLERVAYEFIEDMNADGIIYAEVRFCPYFHLEQGLTMADVVKAVLNGLNRGRANYGVEFGLLICGMHNLSPHTNLELAQLAQQFHNDGVVGYDFAGVDLNYPLVQQLPVIEYLHAQQLPFTVHTGEMASAEYILEAVKLGATRLGHCAKIFDEQLSSPHLIAETLQLIKDNNIHIEINITSNLCTGAATLGDHPFAKLITDGFNIALNTDDRLMFGNNLSNEYLLAVQSYNLTVTDLKQLNLNAANSCFLKQPQKDILINKLNAWQDA